MSTNKKLLVSWQFFGPYGLTKYGSGWRKAVVNQCLEFAYYAVWLLCGLDRCSFVKREEGEEKWEDEEGVCAKSQANWLVFMLFLFFGAQAAWGRGTWCCSQRGHFVVFQDYIVEKVKKIGGFTTFNNFIMKELEIMYKLLNEIKTTLTVSWCAVFPL